MIGSLYLFAPEAFAETVFRIKVNDTDELADYLIRFGPVGYLSVLLVYVGMLIATFIVVRLLHRRYARTVITAAKQFNWSRLFFAAFLSIATISTLAAIGHFSGLATVKYTFNSEVFIGFAIVSLLFIPLQSASEEIIVRGYLNQGFGRFISNKWVVFAITSLLFSVLHLANPESRASADTGMLTHITVMGTYFMFGFILCIIVYFEGGLEAVIGVHAANNLFASVLVNYEGSVLPTPSVFLAGNPQPIASFFTIVLFFGIVTVGLYLTRKKLPPLEASNIILKPAVQRL